LASRATVGREGAVMLKELIDALILKNLSELNARDKMRTKLLLGEQRKEAPAAKKIPQKTTAFDVVYFALFIIFVVFLLWKC
jgi:hypothetical protein